MSLFSDLVEYNSIPCYFTFVLHAEFAMAILKADRLTTTVSTKGQVILPKAIRDQRRWPSGTKLVVRDTPEGVLLSPEPVFPPTTVDEVFGMLKYDGPPISIEEMDAAVGDMFRQRYGREYDRD